MKRGVKTGTNKRKLGYRTADRFRRKLKYKLPRLKIFSQKGQKKI